MVKIIKFVLCFGIMFCISLGIVNVQANTSDTTAPILNSITFSNTNVDPGGKLYFSIDANDDISGIENIAVEFYHIDKAIDNFHSNEVVYSDNMFINIPNNVKSGEYYIGKISITDKVGNTRNYHNKLKPIPTANNVEWGEYSQNININSIGQDITSPEIKDINIPFTNLTADETLNLNIVVEDDKSGIDYATFCLYSKTNELECFQGGTYSDETKQYLMSIPVASLKENGTYSISSITVYDYAGNRADISRYGIDLTELENKIINMSIYVSGKTVDNEAPVYKSINIDKTKVTIPSVVKMTIDVQDNSGMDDNAYVTFLSVNDSNNAITGNLYYNQETLKYEGYIDINQYIVADKYKLNSVYLCDKIGNCTMYSIKSDNKYDELIDRNLEDEIYLEVVAQDTYEVITSTTDNNIIEKIKNASNDAKISIDSTNNSIISKDVFETIKGTNKTIYIETNGIEWIFNGNDINNPKEIDVSVNLQMIYDYSDATLTQILDKALIIDFANNGELPGKALVRIKADYTLRNYMGVEDLYVYYYDINSKMFNKVTNSISVNEYYYEFYITHNSIYTLTNQKIADEYVTDDMSDLKVNLESAETSEKKQKNIDYSIIYICLAILLITVVVIIIFIKKRKNKKLKKNEIDNKEKTEN